MARKPQRAGNNTVSHAAKVFQGANDIPMIPMGFPQDNLEYSEVWATFVTARPADDWLPSDLVILARVVKTEIDIRKLDKQRDEEGFLVLNEKGTAQIENPLSRALDSLIRQQLAMVRSLHLTAGTSNPTEVRTAAKQNVQNKNDREALNDGLLAN